jgi:uncharacterized membrane protein YGL010W
MTRAVAAHFADYDAVHQARGNKVCHAIGIPFLGISILGLLARVAVAGPMTAAEVAILIVCLWYWRVAAALAPAMLIAFAVLDGLGRALPLPALMVLFVVGWMLQLVGHYVYEKRAPAFARNLVHLLIGPLWTVSQVVGRRQ